MRQALVAVSAVKARLQARSVGLPQTAQHLANEEKRQKHRWGGRRWDEEQGHMVCISA